VEEQRWVEEGISPPLFLYEDSFGQLSSYKTENQRFFFLSGRKEFLPLSSHLPDKKRISEFLSYENRNSEILLLIRQKFFPSSTHLLPPT